MIEVEKYHLTYMSNKYFRQNHQQILKFVGRIMRNGYLHSLKVSFQNIIINYKEENSNHTTEKHSRHHINQVMLQSPIRQVDIPCLPM